MSEDAMDIAYSEQYEADLEWHKKALAYAKDQLRMEYAESDAMREELQTLRDERDRLRGLLQEIAFDCEHVGSIQHLDKAERRTWMSVANRIKAALTPAGGQDE